MRILIAAAEVPPTLSGQAEVVGRSQVGLRALGHEVDVVTLEPEVPLGEASHGAFAVRLPKLRNRLREYDVVNLHGPAPAFSDLILMAWQTVPEARRPALVYTHHADIAAVGGARLWGAYHHVHRWLIRAADQVIVSSDGYRRILREAGPRTISVVPLAGAHDAGTDLTIHLPRPSRFTVAFVGRLRPYKGVDVLLRAAAELPDIDFDVVGTGHQGAQLRDLARRLRLSNVRWHGALDNSGRDAVLRRAHAVALPSLTRSEGFGMVLVEGMRAGCVPIASDLPGVREVAGETGLLVKPGSVRSLVEALCFLRDDQGEWTRRSLASRQTATRYRWDGTVLGYHRALSEARIARHLRRSRAPEPIIDLLRAASFSDRASLMLLDPDAGHLRIAAVSGLPLPVEALLAGGRPGHRLAWNALLGGEPLVLREQQAGPGRRVEVKRALLVPVTGSGSRGVISLSRISEREFDQGEVDWVLGQSRRMPLPDWEDNRDSAAQESGRVLRLYSSWRWG